jgi:hypothetical protein
MLPKFSLWYRKETPGLAWTCVILSLVGPKVQSLKVVRKMRDVFWKVTTSGNSQARRKRNARKLSWDVCRFWKGSIILSFSWTNCPILLTFSDILNLPKILQVVKYWGRMLYTWCEVTLTRFKDSRRGIHNGFTDITTNRGYTRLSYSYSQRHT